MDPSLLRMLEDGSDAYWEWHVPNGQVSYNGAWGAMLGYRPDEVPSNIRQGLALVHPADRMRVYRAVRKFIRSAAGQSRGGISPRVELEFRLRHKSGEWHWVLYRGRVTRWLANGSPETLFGVQIDIHARKLAQDLAKRYDCLFNSMSEIACLVNAQHRYEAVNDAWVHATQIERPRVIGKRIDEIWGADSYSELIRPHLDACFAGQTAIYDAWLGTDAHGKRHFNVSMFPYRGTNGGGDHVTHALVVRRDTTFEKSAERELLQAWRAAEQASHAKTSFLANMSHEIRTPLNAIVGMSFLLKQTLTDGKQSEYVNKIDSAANHLLRIVNDILDYSKADAGVIALENVEFNLDDVLANLLRLTSLQARQKGLDLRLDVSSETPRSLVGDPVRTAQVLLNLIDNAIKFTHGGQVLVSIEPVPAESSGIRLRFTVKDTGIGIAETQLKRIFEPFSQADTSSARRYGGTGLGLALVKRFVKLMDGTINIESAPGRGTLVSFSAKFGRPSTQVTASGKYRSLKAGRRALVVDNDPESRAWLTKLLSEFSFDVCSVETGSAGIEELRRARSESVQGFDLLLLDSALPDIEWPEAVQRMRREQAGSPQAALVLIVSSNASVHDLGADNAGLDGLLPRPITHSSLYNIIVNAVARGGLPSHTESEPTEPDTLPVSEPILRGARILLVEDNEVNQQIAAEILRLAGCDVTLAGNGLEALSALLSADSAVIVKNMGAAQSGSAGAGAPRSAAAGGFDAVLMDLQMQGMDGYRATRRIRADRRFVALPIIAMTADAVPGVREKCLDAGMNDYLTKPFKPNDLYATLARWIASARTAQYPAPPLKSAEPDWDCDAALARVSGNRTLYRRLAHQFFEKYEHAAAEVSAALQRHARDDAARLLHTVKGVAANLGFNALSRAARLWEARVKASESDGAESAAFYALFIRSRGQLEAAFPHDATPHGERAVPPPVLQDDVATGAGALPLAAQLDILKAMLANQDMSAGSLARTIAASVRGTEFESEFERVHAPVLQLRYSEALAILTVLIERLQPS